MEKKKKIIYIKDLENNSIESFTVTDKFVDFEEKGGPCDYCKIKEYCDNEKRYKIYCLEEGAEKYPRQVSNDPGEMYSCPCEYFSGYDTCIDKKFKRNVNKGTLLKKNTSQVYGDESEKLQEYLDLGFILLPNDIIENFCKKTCLHWNGENFLCMKELSCPFYEFLNNCFDVS